LVWKIPYSKGTVTTLRLKLDALQLATDGVRIGRKVGRFSDLTEGSICVNAPNVEQYHPKTPAGPTGTR